MDRAEVAVSQWSREWPDFDPLPVALIGRLAEAAHVVARDHLNPLFARYGLGPGEFDVLATLRRSGEPFILSPTALYETTMISSGAMTNRLDRLERAGFIARGADAADRRAKPVILTAQGRQVIEDALLAHLHNEKRILAGLTLDDQHRLNGLLAKLIASLPDAAK